MSPLVRDRAFLMAQFGVALMIKQPTATDNQPNDDDNSGLALPDPKAATKLLVKDSTLFFSGTPLSIISVLVSNLVMVHYDDDMMHGP
jgi:hypothetical protein